MRIMNRLHQTGEELPDDPELFTGTNPSVEDAVTIRPRLRSEFGYTAMSPSCTTATQEPKRFGAASHQSFRPMPNANQHNPFKQLVTTNGKYIDLESFVLMTSAMVDIGAK